MPYVTLSPEAYEVLMGTASKRVRDITERMSDGSRRFMIDDAQYARIEQALNPGESHSAFVLRMAAILRSDGHHRAKAARQVLH